MLLLSVIRINPHTMKHFAVFLIVMFLGLQQSIAQQINFGDSTIVSLITCEPGEEIYAKFGHTAIRIRDTQGLDLTYNYGLFDFRTDNFYWKFVRGQTDYVLGVTSTASFLSEYKERNSTVWEQELNLDRSEKQKLIGLLKTNYEPQNRTYRYNFVFNNCSTIPQDIIFKSINGVLVDDKTASDETYREIIAKFLKDDAWVDLGINLVFGLDADKIAGEQGKVFIPENLKSYFQRAKIISMHGDGRERQLVGSLHELVQAQDRPISKTSIFLHPFTLTLFLLFAGVILTVVKVNRKNRVCRIFDTVLYLFTGVVGVVLLFFSFFSVHPLVANNIDLLWLNPLNIVVAFMLWHKGARKFLFFYNIVYLLLIIIHFVVTVFFVHAAIPTLIPLLILVFIRTLRREQRLLHILFTPSSDGLKWEK